MNKEVLLSIIMPVYNTERYIVGSIESIINQTLDFEENIELILVNNATTDNAGIICQEYASKYLNIKYISLQSNIGPSGARNIGLKVAVGKYINYMDSDDLWENDALEKLINYLEGNRNVAIAVGRMHVFGKIDIWHRMDWRYEEFPLNVDIIKMPDYVQHYLCPAVIRRELAVRYSHDEELFNEEDMLYLNHLILEVGEFVLLKDSVYLHRVRTSNDSSLQNVYNNPKFFTTTIENAYLELIDFSRRKYREVIPYIQNLLMYGIGGRVQHSIDCKEEIDVDKYINNLILVLKDIDDSVILAQKFIPIEYKLYSLGLKRGCINPYENHRLLAAMKRRFPYSIGLRIKTSLVYNNKIHISGFVRYPYPDPFSLFIEDKNGKREVLMEESDNSLYAFDVLIACAKDFFVIRDYIIGDVFWFVVLIDGREIKQKILFDKHGRYERNKLNCREYCIECITER